MNHSRFVSNGLGAVEFAAMRRLSPTSLGIITDELDEPESRETVLEVLRARDPEAALAAAIAENVRRAVEDCTCGTPDSGMGKSFFKKLRKLHSKIVAAVKKVHKTIAKPIVKVQKAVAKTTLKVTKKIALADPLRRMAYNAVRRPSSSSSAPIQEDVAQEAPAPEPTQSDQSSQYLPPPQVPYDYRDQQPPAYDYSPGSASSGWDTTAETRYDDVQTTSEDAPAKAAETPAPVSAAASVTVPDAPPAEKSSSGIGVLLALLGVGAAVAVSSKK